MAACRAGSSSRHSRCVIPSPVTAVTSGGQVSATWSTTSVVRDARHQGQAPPSALVGAVDQEDRLQVGPRGGHQVATVAHRARHHVLVRQDPRRLWDRRPARGRSARAGPSQPRPVPGRPRPSSARLAPVLARTPRRAAARTRTSMAADRRPGCPPSSHARILAAACAFASSPLSLRALSARALSPRSPPGTLSPASTRAGRISRTTLCGSADSNSSRAVAPITSYGGDVTLAIPLAR